MKFTMYGFLCSQFATLPPVDCPDLTARVVIVTGSNVYVYAFLVVSIVKAVLI